MICIDMYCIFLCTHTLIYIIQSIYYIYMTHMTHVTHLKHNSISRFIVTFTFASARVMKCKEMNAHLLVLCDLPNQHLAERLGTALLEGFGKSSASGQPQWHVLMAIPRLEVFSGDVPVWHDFRWT